MASLVHHVKAFYAFYLAHLKHCQENLNTDTVYNEKKSTLKSAYLQAFHTSDYMQTSIGLHEWETQKARKESIRADKSISVSKSCSNEKRKHRSNKHRPNHRINDESIEGVGLRCISPTPNIPLGL